MPDLSINFSKKYSKVALRSRSGSGPLALFAADGAHMEPGQDQNDRKVAMICTRLR